MTLEIFHKSWYSMTNKSSRTNEHFFLFGIIRTRGQYEQICMYRSKQSKNKMFKLVQMIKTSSQKQISFLIQYYSLYPRSYSAIIRTIPFKASWNYCKYWIKIPFWKMNPLEDFVNSVYFGQNLNLFSRITLWTKSSSGFIFQNGILIQYLEYFFHKWQKINPSWIFVPKWTFLEFINLHELEKSYSFWTKFHDGFIFQKDF